MTTEDNSIVDQFAFEDDLNMSIDSNPENSREEVARKLIAEELNTCSVDELESKIFAVVCPIFKNTLVEVVDEVEREMREGSGRNNPRIFDDRFIKCQEALEPWSEMMNHLQACGKSCEASKLKSLIDSFPTIVTKISGLCKSRRQQHPQEQLPPLLSELFRKSCSIARIFFNLLNANITFSPQNDFDMVRKIIVDVADISRLTTYDLVTMGQSWKTFMKLSVSHKDILVERDCVDDIREQFKHLGATINSLYSNILKSSVELFEKRAKCTVFLLTILDRLHLVFCKNQQLSDDFINQMIPIMINLCANHAMCTGAKLGNDQRELYKARAKIISSNLPNTIVNYYTELSNFWKIFTDEFNEVKKMKELKYAVGYHSILLSTVAKWKLPDLFGIAIDNINYLQEEILICSMDFPGVDNEQNTVYDSTLSVLVDYVIEKVDDFEIYEEILLRNLLSEYLWPSMISHDILQQLYKVSDGDLPLTHIEHFMRAYEVVMAREDSLAVVMLRSLIIDIYDLLSDDSRDEVLRKCNSPGSVLLLLKNASGEFTRSKQLALYRKITAVESPSNLPQVIANVRSQPTVENWNRLVELLRVMGVLREKTSSASTEGLCDISSFVINALEECTGWRKRMLLDVTMLLFDCAQIDAGEQSFNWTLVSVLFTGVTHSPDLPTDFLIKLCHYLTSNAHRLNSTGEENIPIISNVFCFLLEHTSDFVRQEALEAYEHIVEHCSNDDLVGKVTRTISQRPKLREIVPAYLRKEVLGKLGLPSITEYLRLLSINCMEPRAEHSCHEEEEEPVHEDKRFKSNANDVEERVDKVCEDLKTLYDERQDLDPRIIRKLVKACSYFAGE